MNFKKYILTFVVILATSILFSQEKNDFGYHIEGDEVVFRFDQRDYKHYTDDRQQKRIDFEDFDINKVVLSGNFNMWSRDAWKMEKIDDNIYELRKKLADFKDEFVWEFKYVINNHIWAEPSYKAPNISNAKDELGKYTATYNLRFYKSQIAKDGNAKFFLEGYENAEKVVLAGSFNRWNGDVYQMEKRSNGWALKLELPPGTYEYKFVIDGEWIEDPANNQKVRNEYWGFNSVIEIDTEVSFILNGYKDAKQVILSGDFNDWSETGYSMKRTANGWKFKTRLVGGKYHYKFIVDGVWITDPDNKVKEYDNKGNINSVKMVK